MRPVNKSLLRDIEKRVAKKRWMLTQSGLTAVKDPWSMKLCDEIIGDLNRRAKEIIDNAKIEW